MENKLIQFDLNLISQSSTYEIISELEEALSLKFDLYDGDLYDGDEVWYCNILGIQIELHHFPDDNIFNLKGETEGNLLGEIIEDNTKFVEISFQVYNKLQQITANYSKLQQITANYSKLQQIYPNRKWEVLPIGR